MTCHTSPEPKLLNGGSIALVGHPNVGKSAIFQRLTGQRVIVSNYPGTTVEVTRGAWREMPQSVLVDTPGVIAFPPHSDDELVTAHVLLDEPLEAVLQVGDAKNLRRTLLLTLQLAEMGRPLVLALNMMDEAQARGVRLDLPRLSELLGASVVPTTATRSEGLGELGQALRDALAPDFSLTYPQVVEAAVADFCARLEAALAQTPPVTRRSLALLWLSGDPVTEGWLRQHLDAEAFDALSEARQRAGNGEATPLIVHIQRARLNFIEGVLGSVLLDAGEQAQGWGARLSRLTTHPLWGWFILGGVLYALYWFVGVFGASTLVGWLENDLFGKSINPWVTGSVQAWISIPWLADFLVGEYGLWTMGATYALALILPIVTTFFLAFGIMEDSFYLPRLAALSNRLLQLI